MLDPNKKVFDDYLNIELDTSKIMFVCTATSIEYIPPILTHYLETLPIVGYTKKEKIEITKKFLIGPAKQKYNLDNKIVIEDLALAKLVEEYDQIAGLSILHEYIEELHKKVAIKVINTNQIITVSCSTLQKFIGLPVLTINNICDTTSPSVVRNLSWTSYGGSTSVIECTIDKSLGSENTVKLTGLLGDTLKESVYIALTVAKNYLHTHELNNKVFDAGLHIHFPDGNTKKDGPRAGIALVMALLSLAKNKAIRPRLAMTGEITLTGMILPIGGIPEKILAVSSIIIFYYVNISINFQ